MQAWGLPHTGHDIDNGESGWFAATLTLFTRKGSTEDAIFTAVPHLVPLHTSSTWLYRYFKNRNKTLVEEAAAKVAKAETEGAKNKMWRLAPFSMHCVTIKSDTLNNSVSDSESSVCLRPLLRHSQKAAAPLVVGHTIKRTITLGCTELISSGL